MSKEAKTEMSIADYKIENVKISYRWFSAFMLIVGIVIGLTGSYFTAVNVVTSTQNSAIEVVKQLQAETTPKE
jgi:hypothetical protein